MDLPRSQLLGILEEAEFLGDAGLASDFLDYVDQRAGLLVGQGGDGSRRRPQSYAFPHRTFQEYLAGCYLVGGRGVRRAYWEKVAEGDYWYLAAMYGAEELLHNRRNEQALLDLAYDLCPNAQPADEWGWRALVWSGQMAALLGADAIRRDTGGPQGGGVYLERVKRGLKALLAETHLTPLERAEAGKALAALGDPRKGVGVVTRQGVSLPDIDWVEIPETDAQGRREFIYQENERRVEPTFWMAQYPITYAQFQTFIDAPDGWRNPEWRKGLALNDQNRPGEQRFPYGNHPRENVSWYQAVAFCRWLTEQYRRQPELLPAALAAGAGWRVSLPTEWQWEKAARGHDGREYPWGNGYRSGYANVNETEGKAGPHYLASTSAVGIYPQGASPYGILDLSGNVWEWCLNEYSNPQRIQEEGSEGRVLRGGAWSNNRYDAAAAFRSRDYPYYRWYFVGFRVVWSASVPVPSL